MNDLPRFSLDDSPQHSADLLEAAEFIRAMLIHAPLTDTAEHYEALAARLNARGAAIVSNLP